MVLSSDYKVRYANPAALMVVGFSGDHIGSSCRDFFRTCPLDPTSTECDCNCSQVKVSGIPLKGRYVIEKGDGPSSVFDFECTTTAAGEYVMTMVDVTAAVKVEDMLERYAEGLSVLYELSSVFLSARKMDVAIEMSLNMLNEHYMADVVAVAVPVEGTNELEYISVVGCETVLKSGLKVTASTSDMPGFAILESCPAIVTDYASENRFKRSELFESCGIKSGICVPMTVDQVAVGVLCFMYLEPKGFDTSELWYMNVAANSLAVYIEKERSLERVEESQAYLTSVLDGIGDGVIVVDKSFNVKFASKGPAEAIGDIYEEHLKSKCYKIAHGKDVPCYESGEECPVRATLDTGKPFSALHTHIDGKGNDLHVQLNSYPIFDSSGEVVAAVETMFDISDRMNLELDLEKRVKELEEFYDMAVGRELRMVELKEDIEKLEKELQRLKDA